MEWRRAKPLFCSYFRNNCILLAAQFRGKMCPEDTSQFIYGFLFALHPRQEFCSVSFPNLISPPVEQLQDRLLGDNIGSLVSSLACYNGNGQRGTTVWFDWNQMWRVQYPVISGCNVSVLHKELSKCDKNETERRDCLSVCCCLVYWSVYKLPVRGQRSLVWHCGWNASISRNNQGLPLPQHVYMADLTNDIYIYINPNQMHSSKLLINAMHKCVYTSILTSVQLVNRSSHLDKQFLLVCLISLKPLQRRLVKIPKF